MPYKDKDQQRAYSREYQRSEKHKAYKREWTKANRAKLTERQRMRYKADPKKYRRYFRERHLFKTYGITQEQYEQMYRNQRGVCAICDAMPDIYRHGVARLCIDHCHATGKVRGLLCNNCNAGIALIGDTVEHLEQALSYLRKAESKEA